MDAKEYAGFRVRNLLNCGSFFAWILSECSIRFLRSVDSLTYTHLHRSVVSYCNSTTISLSLQSCTPRFFVSFSVSRRLQTRAFPLLAVFSHAYLILNKYIPILLIYIRCLAVFDLKQNFIVLRSLRKYGNQYSDDENCIEASVCRPTWHMHFLQHVSFVPFDHHEIENTST